jgi:hypothetical protein
MLNPPSPAALIVAHPGHEIRIHGWLTLNRPQVFVITEGSGRSGQPRINSTSKYLAEIGCRRGSIFGRLTDLEAYRALLNHDFAVFINLTDEMTGALLSEQVKCALGDAAEGYNSVHDVCRLMINTAVEIANRSGGKLTNFDFPVTSRPDDCPPSLCEAAIWLKLDEKVFAQKLAMARRYYPELVAEVEASLSDSADGPLRRYLEHNYQAEPKSVGQGLDMFRVECLRPALSRDTLDDFVLHPPFYERQGEQQVAAGHYSQVIRHCEHVRPLADALGDWAARIA